MNEKQRELARHALGFPNKRNTSYRNYFSIGPEGDDYAEWEDLVANGLAVKRASTVSPDFIFHLNLKGALLARNRGEHLSMEDAVAMGML